jgi:NADP-dependent 3-hydroxy acid dehydrogenase YdfG
MTHKSALLLRRENTMKKTILVCGHGPGISDAVARRFGKEDFAVALVARNKERLGTAVEQLRQAGVTAQAFPGDLGDPNAVRAIVRGARSVLGPIGVVHWNAYSGGAGDLTTANLDEVRTILDVSVHGLLAAVQESLPDLRAAKGAVLVTGGGLSAYDPKVDATAVAWGAMGLAIGKAAQHKAVGLLHAKLGAEGIYAGDVVVLGLVKGTAWDSGNATLDPADIAAKFWEIYTRRDVPSVTFG